MITANSIDTAHGNVFSTSMKEFSLLAVICKSYQIVWFHKTYLLKHNRKPLQVHEH